MNPIERLRRTADEAERQAAQLEAKAARLREMAAGVRAAVAKALTSGEQTATVNRDMLDVHRVAISAGRRKDAFLDAIRAKGYTLRKLAHELKIPPSLLSMYRGGDDPRPIPQARAERIEKLTGWPADSKHWPHGIV